MKIKDIIEDPKTQGFKVSDKQRMLERRLERAKKAPVLASQMTLRDYIAVEFMKEYLRKNSPVTAGSCYRAADEMMEARGK